MTDGGHGSTPPNAPPPQGSAAPGSPGPVEPRADAPTGRIFDPNLPQSPVPRRRFPVVCLVFTLLTLGALAVSYNSYWDVMGVRVPPKPNGEWYPQPVFDAAVQEAQYSSVLNAGGLSLESIGGHSQLWRLLTVNFCASETAFSTANMPPFVMLIFSLVFIWLNFQIYEYLLGSLRFAGFLVVTGLAAGTMALFRHAGLPYPGAYPFFLAVTVGFAIGSFRGHTLNRKLGEPYFLFMDLFVAGIQVVLCLFMMRIYSFIWIPSAIVGALCGGAFLWTVPLTPRQKNLGVIADPRLIWGFVGLSVLLLGLAAWSSFDAGAHLQNPALRAARLGFAPASDVVIGFDAGGVIHIARGDGSTQVGAQATPPQPAVNPGTTPPPNPNPGTNPGPNPGTTNPPPVLTNVDVAQQKEVADFDDKIAAPFFAAKADLLAQLNIAGWPSEMEKIVQELKLDENLKQGFQPIADYKTELPGLVSLTGALKTEYQCYTDWLALIAKAPDDTALTVNRIAAALKKARDATDRRRDNYLNLARTLSIRSVSSELRLPIPGVKPTTVQAAAEEFRNLYENTISLAEGTVEKWLNQLAPFQEKPMEVKKLIETGTMIEQLKSLLADVQKATVKDPMTAEYQAGFQAELQALIEHFEFIRAHSTANERDIWRAIEDDGDKWGEKKVKRIGIENRLLERFNFKR
ncbi:MAG TPA: rhomboid family intramembrane serine protease [Planctomycetota bacterium]|nr:rhomboid family intramembrane serine protease [Planctomycetota bacterium]